MNKLRIAAIGARIQGHAGLHYKALKAQDHAELCAACDLDEKNLKEAAGQFSIPALYADYHRMIKEQQPDAVMIIMKPMQMVPIALDCLDMGLHLLLEKPPGCTYADAKKILDRARAAGCKVMVSMDRRFIPLVQQVKRLAHQRGLVACSATYNKGMIRTWEWPASLAVADAIHLIDLLCYVCGTPEAVYAESTARNTNFHNSSSALITFKSSIYATVNSHQCVGARQQRFEIHAMGLSAYMNLNDVSGDRDYQLWVDGKETHLDIPAIGDDPKIVRLNSVYQETSHFIRWLTNQEPAQAELGDVIESARLAEAIDAGYKGALRNFNPPSDR